MTKGFVFRNGTIDYTVLDYAETRFGNIVLLQRNTYCPFVAARVITPEPLNCNSKNLRLKGAVALPFFMPRISLIRV
ncbi:MAG: hypothetical protein ACLUHK_02510 [Eubacteriales bacterium]